nr:Retrovirus-related Pol polyprotein from transposon RE1 [Ipomoea batatas]
MESCKSICTHLSQNEKFSKDEGVEKVDVTAHRSIIGCLMFLTATRPNIMFPLTLASTPPHDCLALYSAPSCHPWENNIPGNLRPHLSFHPLLKINLSFMHCASELHYTTAKRILSWSSTKQDVVAQSTAEAECVAPALAVNQALWLRKLLTDLKMIQEEATTIFVDN